MSNNDLIAYGLSLDQNNENYSLIKGWLDEYASTCRKYFKPIFTKQTITDLHLRNKDLLGGVFFTNSRYPWPKTDGNGLPMQPIVQIDLEAASNRMDENLGDGLLQMWARVDESLESLNVIANPSLFSVRVIPKTEIFDCNYCDIPEHRPWESSICNGDGDSWVTFPDGPIEMKNGSTITWIPAGAMYSHPYCLRSGHDESNFHLFEEVFSDLTGLVDSPKKNIPIYMGGHGGQAGGYEDPTAASNLLFRLYDEQDLHVGITYHRNKRTNALIFNGVLRYW